MDGHVPTDLPGDFGLLSAWGPGGGFKGGRDIGPMGTEDLDEPVDRVLHGTRVVYVERKGRYASPSLDPPRMG